MGGLDDFLELFFCGTVCGDIDLLYGDFAGLLLHVFALVGDVQAEVDGGECTRPQNFFLIVDVIFYLDVFFTIVVYAIHTILVHYLALALDICKRLHCCFILYSRERVIYNQN